MSEVWINAREAREAVSPGCNFVGQATDAICRYAAVGLVRARAAMFTVEGEGKRDQLENHLIAADFWNLKLEKQDWVHGVFLGVERSMSWEIRCEALGVTFERKGIEAMVPTSSANDSVTTAKRGRPPGSGSFAASDAILVEKMHEYVTNHPGTSANSAAEKFISEAAGGGTDDVRRRRLAGRYRRAYPN